MNDVSSSLCNRSAVVKPSASMLCISQNHYTLQQNQQVLMSSFMFSYIMINTLLGEVMFSCVCVHKKLTKHP